MYLESRVTVGGIPMSHRRGRGPGFGICYEKVRVTFHGSQYFNENLSVGEGVDLQFGACLGFEYIQHFTKPACLCLSEGAIDNRQ